MRPARPRPKHLSPTELIWVIRQERLFISPKADGEYRQCSLGDRQFDAEYIDGVHHIFDEAGCRLDFISRISRLNPDKPNRIAIDSVERALKVLEDQSIEPNFTFHMTKWRPKLWFEIDTAEFGLGSILELLEINPGDYLDYPTDGWIIRVLESREIYKVKPSHQMTIDLRFKDGGWYDLEDHRRSNVDGDGEQMRIYRMERVGDRWRPREVRVDKSIPNPKSVIDVVERFHRRPWTPTQLYPFTQLRYYGHRPLGLDPEVVAYLADQKQLVVNELSTIVYENGFSSMLDLGCGKGFLSQLDLDYTGVDLDPYSIALARRRHPGKSFYVGDFTTHLEAPPFPSAPRRKYDLIVFNHSVHSVANADQLVAIVGELLDDWLTRDGMIYFRYLDRFEVRRCLIPKTSHWCYESIDTERYRFHYPWLPHPVEERPISSDELRRPVREFKLRIRDLPRDLISGNTSLNLHHGLQRSKLLSRD